MKISNILTAYCILPLTTVKPAETLECVANCVVCLRYGNMGDWTKIYYNILTKEFLHTVSLTNSATSDHDDTLYIHCLNLNECDRGYSTPFTTYKH